MTLPDALEELSVESTDDVAVAVADRLSQDVAAQLTRRINERLDQAGVPVAQRTWIVATTGDDEAVARIVAAVSDFSGGARVIVHDSREPDDLTFHRRIPDQRRGGVYLNHAWQAAAVRIACGDPLIVVDGLSAWFNQIARLSADDLHADVLLSG